MTNRTGLGPDLVIAGAARSGTTLLAARLSVHPRVDPGTAKEPNYFSRYFDRGPDWYEQHYEPRSPDVLRLDASTSYTYPQFPDALERLAHASPTVFVVYLVREPVERAVSHYLFYRHYFRREPAKTFGAALERTAYYTQVSDYSHWIAQLRAYFPPARLLVVPFETVTSSSQEVADLVYDAVGLPPQRDADEKKVLPHRNNVVEFRAEVLRLAAKMLRRNPAYLRARAVVGAHRVRRLRQLLTREAELPSTWQALATCDRSQLAELQALRESCTEAVGTQLREQNASRGLDWSTSWREMPAAASP